MNRSSIRKYVGLVVLCLLLAGGAFVRSEAYREWLDQQRKARVAAALKSSGLRFEDITMAAGLQFRYAAPKLSEVLVPEDLHVIGAGLAVADVNGDGLMDFYVVTAAHEGSNQLYLNQGNATFKEAAATWGIQDLNRTVEEVSANPTVPPKNISFASLFPLFMDVNLDGKPDLLVAGLGGIKLFENRGSHFEVSSQVGAFLDAKNAQSLVPLDYNKDGFQDLYVVRYFADRDLFTTLDENTWVNSTYNATNGGTNTLYKNNGDGPFTDVTAQVGGGDRHWGFDAAAGDFTGNGALQILISNDFGPDVLFELQEGKFVDVSRRLGAPDRRLGMGVSFGYLDETARPFIHVSNAYHPGYRHEGNFLWHADSSGNFADEALPRGSNYCLWAWGSVFADFDLDGWQDLYVANGFISGTERKEFVPDIYVDTQAGKGDASFKMGTLEALPGAVLSRGSVFADMFSGEAAVGRLSFAGYQRDCLFLSHDGSFANVATQAGLDDYSDGRAVASIDIDNNGSLDLLVSTRNEGVKLFRNTLEPGMHWIGFQLTDKRGNALPSGVAVRIAQDGQELHRNATAGKSGFLAMSDARLVFGLRGSTKVDAEIRWPSGTVQRLTALQPGKYHVVIEP
ncbi:MAG: CRTAC1 family protein [Deltaproteobacteria bacterium]|nr:CRTAC1 family protein [Deltaproteobacteria bacterium]